MPRRYGASATLMTTSIASEEVVDGNKPTMVSERERDGRGGERVPERQEIEGQGKTE